MLSADVARERYMEREGRKEGRKKGEGERDCEGEKARKKY